MAGRRRSSAPHHSAKRQAAARGVSDAGRGLVTLYFTPRMSAKRQAID
jgi:hypothetical protein